MAAICQSASSQDLFWRSEFNSFFDNVEFGGSRYKVPQTMAGVTISPEAGFRWDSVHTICTGISLMHEFGSNKAIDYYWPSAYFRYKKNRITFQMGAFPRSEILKSYSRLFFQDSVSYYRPNINGMFFGYSGAHYYINVWLDWTGRQTTSTRETFLVGLDGKYSKGILFARHNSYMFHFAGRKDPFIDEALHDNILMINSAGVDLSGKSFLTRLEGSLGWVLGLERARADNTGWILMNGFQADVCAEYKFAGIRNSLYAGRGQMHFYNDHEIDLYWGDPAYRSGLYNRSDLYIKFLKKRGVDLELTWSLHILEGKLFNEQMLKLRVVLPPG